MKSADIKVRDEIYAVKTYMINPLRGVVLDNKTWVRRHRPVGDQKRFLPSKGGYSWDTKGLPVVTAFRGELLTEQAIAHVWELLQAGDEFDLPEGLTLAFVQSRAVERTWAEQEVVQAESDAFAAEQTRLREARERHEREAEDRVRAILPTAYVHSTSWVFLEQMLIEYAKNLNELITNPALEES